MTETEIDIGHPPQESVGAPAHRNIPRTLLEPSAIRAHNDTVGIAPGSTRFPIVRMAVATFALILASTACGAAPPTPSDLELVSRLIACLKDPDADVRANLAQALAKIGPTAVEPLTEALADALPQRRAGAAYALGLMGSVAKATLPQLLLLLDDSDTEVRRQASQAITRMLPTTKPTPKATGGQKP